MNRVLHFLLLLQAILFQTCKEVNPNINDWKQLQLDEINAREKYLQENNITVEPTESGLYYIEIIEGIGESPVEAASVEVNYEARLLNEEIIDSGSIIYNFGVGLVIVGFDEAVGYMKKGGTATAIIPSELAYGDYYMDNIPKYSTLIYDIELIEVYSHEKELADRAKYLTDNNIEVQPTESGLYYIEKKEGTGAKPLEGDIVYLAFSVKLLSGEEVYVDFDDLLSYKEEEMIKGLYEALGYMKEGGIASLIIPSELAYGINGYNSIAYTYIPIPSYSTLLYEIEFISISQ